MYNLAYTLWTFTSDMAPRIRRLLWKQMHMASVEVHGEGSSTSCYDSVVKYLLRSCRGRCVEKSACQTKKTAKKCPILHSGPLSTAKGPCTEWPKTSSWGLNPVLSCNTSLLASSNQGSPSSQPRPNSIQRCRDFNVLWKRSRLNWLWGW